MATTTYASAYEAQRRLRSMLEARSPLMQAAQHAANAQAMMNLGSLGLVGAGASLAGHAPIEQQRALQQQAFLRKQELARRRCAAYANPRGLEYPTLPEKETLHQELTRETKVWLRDV